MSVSINYRTFDVACLLTVLAIDWVSGSTNAHWMLGVLAGLTVGRMNA